MNSESDHTGPHGDPYKRIEELEGQVSELSHLVEQLATRLEESDDWAEEDTALTDPEEPGEQRSVVAGFKGLLGRVLGGEAGESLESRIGGIWLGPVAALLFMTALVLGGAMALRDQLLMSEHKLAIGYGLALLTTTYGFLSKRRENLFAQSVLGCGLSILYFTTYAAFYIDETRVFDRPAMAVPLLGACLLALIVVAHIKRSLTVAGIGLFLIYYTVVLGLNESGNPEHVVYALVTCTMVSCAALVFHLTHRWFFFTWVALFAAYGVYAYFFVLNTPDLGMGRESYFWATSGFLTLTFTLFSLAIIIDACRRNEFRLGVGPMVGFNSFLYFVSMWIDIRTVFPDWEWAFRLVFTAMLGTLALIAHTAGPRRNYLFQIFIAKTVVMFTLALQAYLSHEWLLVAMAIQGIGLGIAYMRSGVIVFKALGMGLMLITFVGCLLAVRLPGEIIVFGWILQARWFSCIAVPVVFAALACFYEHFVRYVPPEERVEATQWFLADTFLDVRGHTAALLHATAGAIILLAITIVDLGDQNALPYILAGQCVVMLIVGYVLRTPQIEVASVMLLIAAHVSFHLFLLLDKPGFPQQPYFTLFTILVATLTFFGGYLWEHYLSRFKSGSLLEHEAIVAIPYLAGTLMLTTLAQRLLPPLYAPLALAGIAAVLALSGTYFRLVGFGVSSALALTLGTANFYIGMYTLDGATTQFSAFAWVLTVFLVLIALVERFAAVGARLSPSQPLVDTGRTILVLIAATLGVLGLYEWAGKEELLYYWIGLAIGFMAVGVMGRESRYRWAALGLYFIAIIRAYLFDLTQLNPWWRFLSFAALCLPLVVISWGYSHYRLRQLRRLGRDSERAESAPDERTT